MFPRRDRSAQPRRGGFTLIELLMVIAIMATMLLIGIKLNRYLAPENDLDGCVRTLATTIEDARADSIVSGQRVFVEFRLGDSRNGAQYYRTIREPLPGHEKDAEDDEYMLTVREWTLLPRNVRIESVIIGETEPFVDGDMRVVIQPDGTMPSHLIRLWSPEIDPNRSRATGWASIQVAGLLGQAKVLNHYVEPEFLREDSFQ